LQIDLREDLPASSLNDITCRLFRLSAASYLQQVQNISGRDRSQAVWSAAINHQSFRSEPGLRGELPASGAEQFQTNSCFPSGVERSDMIRRKRPAHIG
jgi:hypothetical protein